jgi:Zn-dependent protease with chaperone function
MHLIMILISLSLAWFLRMMPLSFAGTWNERWHKALFLSLFPSLLLLTTAISLICMGFKGQMLGMQASWIGYSVAILFLTVAVGCLLKLSYQGYITIRQISFYSQQIVLGKKAKIIKIDFPYSAQIGFWKSQLVISQGLLDSLDREHLEAVLAHEQAHYVYKDTFWFFWLGWLQSLTNWLPNSEILRQELLLLREMRADRIAAQQVDPLLLAESLLTVAKAPIRSSQVFCATFSDTVPANRLEERIDALFTEFESNLSLGWWSWSWIVLISVPLLTVPLHY